jgi:dephospho-CoA kinase
VKIIGISGANGSGKDTMAKFLADKHGWLFISVSDILREGLKRRGLPLERENLSNLSAEWRRASGLGVLVDKAVARFKATPKHYTGLAVASLRNPGEADRVHELGGVVVWLDADPKLRYGRVMGRMRSTEDVKTFEQFLEEEKEEMNRSGDAATLDMAGVKAKADTVIVATNNDIRQFEAAIERSLKQVLSTSD